MTVAGVNFLRYRLLRSVRRPDLSMILVILFHLHNRASAVPFVGVVARLVLNSHSITDLEWCERFRMF